jgi:hypothetical protein
MYETWLIQTTAARTGQPPYADWFKAFAQPDAAQLQAMAQAAEGLKYQPVISLITPVYNPPEPFLRAAIESVMAQVYPHWELCLADDASTAPHVRQVLAEYAARDARIKLSYRDTNGHISVASNTALQCATGQFVALFDHDDTLTPDALFWVARELDLHPDAALIYSDEDKLDYDGVPANPYFKCDWNYDLFLSHNLITHLGVYRADVVKALGGFRQGLKVRKTTIWRCALSSRSATARYATFRGCCTTGACCPAAPPLARAKRTTLQSVPVWRCNSTWSASTLRPQCRHCPGAQCSGCNTS